MKHDQTESASILGPQSRMQTPMDDECNTIIRWSCCAVCRNNAVEQLAGNGTLCTQPVEHCNCSPKKVKEFVSSVTEKCSTLKEIEITNVVIFLSPLDRIFYKKLSFLTNYLNPVTLPNLEALKLSISTPKNKRYKKIFKLLIFFIQGKSRLNRLWEVSTRLQTVDLKCGNETIIKFDKTTKELVVGRFAFISPNEYLLHATTSENGLLKFACFKNRVTLEAMALHKNALTELILNICRIPNVQGICKFLQKFEKLQTLILDCGNEDFTLDIESLLNAPQLKVLVIGHCEVVFNQGFNEMKKKLNGKHVTFFNCVIRDMDVWQNGREEICIDETGKVSQPVKTQWNLKEILKDPTKFPTLESDQHYFELFRMDTFRTYEYRYFRITSSEEPPSSSSLNPTFPTNTIVSQANTPSTIPNANTVRQDKPLQMIANENDLVLQQHTSTLSTEQEILQSNQVVSPAIMSSANPIDIYALNNPFNGPLNESDLVTQQNPFLPLAEQKILPSNPAILISTTFQTENLSIRQHPATPTTSLIPEIPHPQSTKPYAPSTEQGKLLATKLKNVVNHLDRRNQYKEISLKEVFQGYFTALHKYTKIPDSLVTLLKDMGVLDDGSARKIMVTKDTEHTRCCDLIYDHLFKNRDVDLLIHMWEKTTNAHLIKWTQTWLDEKFPSNL